MVSVIDNKLVKWIFAVQVCSFFFTEVSDKRRYTDPERRGGWGTQVLREGMEGYTGVEGRGRGVHRCGGKG